ncbi:MAG TPA: PH domain-containing protein [Clostridiaceae bacterium]|nr:PH domain-containing protein [Clostridiaceae bacterium]
MADKAKPEYLWKDRKRYLGLPLSFTRYYIRDQRLYYSKGLFNTVEEELLLYRVLDIKLSRTLGDKLVGVGTITLFTADKTNTKLDLVRVKNPKQVRDMISRLVEAERARINIQGRELFGVSNPMDIDGDGIMDTIDGDIS